MKNTHQTYSNNKYNNKLTLLTLRRVRGSRPPEPPWGAAPNPAGLCPSNPLEDLRSPDPLLKALLPIYISLCFTNHLPQSYCSRYVQEHMLMHGIDSSHLLTLSMSDLSVWCYGCDDYVHNEVTLSKGSGDRRSSSGFERRSPCRVWGSAPWGFGGS